MNNNKTIIELSFSSIFKFFAVLILFIFLYLIRDVLTIFLVALIFVAALRPTVRYLKKTGIPASISVLSIYIIVFGIIGLLISIIVPQLSSQIKELSSDIPRFIERINNTFGKIPEHERIAQSIQQSLSNISENMTGFAINMLSAVSRFFGGLISFFVILVLVFYMSIAEDETINYIKSLFPKKYEEKASIIVEKIHKKIGSWTRGEVILLFTIGILSFIGLKILGIKFALTLAIIAGIFELIPVIGPVISAIPAIFIAFTQEPVLGLAVLILYIGIQQAENHILVPVVMKKATGLSPIVIILSLLIGAKLLGFIGVLISVPTAVILSVFLEELVTGDIKEKDIPKL
ncbi:hypothetical protein COX95_01585 [bacterium CG_4_10_14_0_2_um_filter_33_32]|nr:MAG: hypothetical protein AUJ93_03915 [bacterium CG2_30_33_46]PIU76520.1 MAG: hypothetical protein COS74_03535 [bacterium CG06_land_8_20_14_3_00_33_50]PIW81204.1 MAG: hypothetical protein COZ97_02930 [bacterium CG_4_8_14_3_um_filter_33_28]PIY85572.1 MAG: hypothetical protein COY76_01390 [bacterium CG_4_10_14_0_8_um_filter_33_57]PIZ86365.1 MAG: hypothetical protein COX95_01585 [bacterium CG_4_10_14_0_2_um_filter_33_32]PJA72606.1 MAG: hypothetical protein CO152_00480 [bacterium CG_4_9_14_3_um